MIRGITFDKQLMKSKDHAHEVNYYYQGDIGVTKGCVPSVDVSNDVVITEGYFIIKGRLVSIEGTETVDVPTVASGTLYSVLVFEIDLTKTNTTNVFNQGSFKVLSNASAYPTPTQQDLDAGGTLYQFEFARFENTVGGLVNFSDTRVILDLSQYARLSDLSALEISNIIGLQTALDGKMAYVKNNLSAIIDPIYTDGSNLGYSVGSVWINTVTDIPFICVDASPNSSVWKSYALDRSTISRFGFKRERGNSDPNTRITYLYDAQSLTPAYMNTTTGNFDYGSWETFIKEVCRPVMLKNDGTVDYELSRDDLTKKSDGITNSDVSNTAYAGNAMIEFRKYKWVYRYSDATYDYVIFSNIQYDANYKAYAHTNALGTVKDAFYWGAFKGSNISSKLRSIADQAVMVSQTRNTEVSFANAIGSGYHTIYKSGWDFINDLLTLISRSDDTQTKFGTGRCASGNTTAISTGTLKKLPMFKGYADQTSDVKVFGIEGFWGNVWEGLAGLVFNGAVKTKMTAGYNFDGTGYTNTGIVPSGTSGGYVSSAQNITDQGYIPSVASGSASTYFCDGLWFNNAQVDYALVGGGWYNGWLAGGRCVNLYDAASNTSVTLGSRVSYINPA